MENYFGTYYRAICDESNMYNLINIYKIFLFPYFGKK